MSDWRRIHRHRDEQSQQPWAPGQSHDRNSSSTLLGPGRAGRHDDLVVDGKLLLQRRVTAGRVRSGTPSISEQAATSDARQQQRDLRGRAGGGVMLCSTRYRGRDGGEHRITSPSRTSIASGSSPTTRPSAGAVRQSQGRRNRVFKTSGQGIVVRARSTHCLRQHHGELHARRGTRVCGTNVVWHLRHDRPEQHVHNSSLLSAARQRRREQRGDGSCNIGGTTVRNGKTCAT